MTSLLNVTLIAALSSSTLLSGKALDDRIKACPKIISQEEFEAAGNHLVLVKKADLTSLQADLFFCSGSHGVASMGSLVFEDGSVSPPGFNGTAFFPLDKNGLPRVEQLDVLGHRFATMRFSPPRLNGSPVCVRFIAGWSSKSPHEFILRSAP